MSRYDVVFIGSSPNALAGAARVANAGLRAIVLETREHAGGPVATETFAPGFRADTCVPALVIDPEVARAIAVDVSAIRRSSVTGLGASPVTLRAMPELPKAFEHAVELMRAIDRTAPPDVPQTSARDGSALRDLASHIGGLEPRAMHEVLRLLFMPARDFFEETVSSKEVRALLSGVALRAVSRGPFAPGTLYGFIRHAAADDALFRSTAVGGVQRIAQALADRAQALGAELRTGVAGPITVELENGIARGAKLGDGTRIEADAVVSDYDARATFTRLVPPSELEPEANRAIRLIRYRGSVARVHLALKELPRFNGADGDALRGVLVAAASDADLERAWDEAKRGKISSRPYLEATLPSLSDPSFAPAGQHVLDVWVQWVPWVPWGPQGAANAAGRAKEVLAVVLDQLAQFSPKLPDLVVHHKVSLPEDLEARFGLTEGHIYGGEVSLEQSFFLRPIPGYARYETPVPNLYLCGTAAHPAGYSGRSGWACAGQLLGAVSLRSRDAPAS